MKKPNDLSRSEVDVSPTVCVNAFAVPAIKALTLAKVNVPALVEKLFDQEGRNSPPIFKE